MLGCYSAIEVLRGSKVFLTCDPLVFNLQCVRVEGANYFYIWLSRLDELPRGSRSSQAYESPL